MDKDHQILMDEVYDLWRAEPTKKRLNIAESLSPLHKIAVQLGNLNYQVENGGFMQWIDNGYCEEDLYDLIDICNKAIELKINNFSMLLNLLNKVKELPEEKTEIEEYNCSHCHGMGYEEYEDEDDNGNIEIVKEDCDYCGGDGTITEEYDNREFIYDECNKLDKIYYEWEKVLTDMQELIIQW